LALLVALVRADHTYHTLAADDLAIAANFLYRSRHSHFSLLDDARCTQRTYAVLPIKPAHR